MNFITGCSSVALAVLLANAVLPAAEARSARSPMAQKTLSIRVFFTNPRRPEFAHTCAAGEFVKRTIPFTQQVADAALRQVFAGPTAREKARGIDAPPPLARFYRGVSIRKGVATVNFRPGAQKLLRTSGPACTTEKALAPLDQTLRQFKTITSVQYAINGHIITNWDA